MMVELAKALEYTTMEYFICNFIEGNRTVCMFFV